MKVIFSPEKIRKIRKKHKLTVYGFGKRLGGRPNYVVNGWEDGTITPTIPSIVQMCEEFNLEPNYFFNLKGGGVGKAEAAEAETAK